MYRVLALTAPAHRSARPGPGITPNRRPGPRPLHHRARRRSLMIRRPFLVAATTLTVSLFLLASAALAQAPKRGGTLRVSYGNEIAHLDFHTAPGYEMMWVAMNVGCGLINITPDGKFVG